MIISRCRFRAGSNIVPCLVVVRDKVGDGQQQHVRMAVIELQGQPLRSRGVRVLAESQQQHVQRAVIYLQGQPLRRSTSCCSGGCSSNHVYRGACLHLCSQCPSDSIATHSNSTTGAVGPVASQQLYSDSNASQRPSVTSRCTLTCHHTTQVLSAACAAAHALLENQARGCMCTAVHPGLGFMDRGPLVPG